MGRWKKLQDDSRILTTVNERVSFSEYFDQAFPDYLAMGMTYEQYWYDDPKIALFYWRANRLKIKNRNQEMYMQGFYNFQAFSRALANLHFDGKHHEIVNYLDEPIDTMVETVVEHEEKG